MSRHWCVSSMCPLLSMHAEHGKSLSNRQGIIDVDELWNKFSKKADQFLLISIVRQEILPVWDATAFIYMIDPVPISCLRATFSFSRFDRVLQVIPIKDIYNCFRRLRSGETVQGNINPELIFRRALALTTCRDDVTVEKLLSVPIGHIPTSLFHDDSTMRKRLILLMNLNVR
jgi:hypothetical protein